MKEELRVRGQSRIKKTIPGGDRKKEKNQRGGAFKRCCTSRKIQGLKKKEGRKEGSLKTAHY